MVGASSYERLTYESVKHLLFICPRHIEQFGGGEAESR